jgi:hypothetical protein
VPLKASEFLPYTYTEKLLTSKSILEFEKQKNQIHIVKELFFVFALAHKTVLPYIQKQGGNPKNRL